MATFGLLHGKWHDGRCWEPLARALEARGHRAVAPDLPLHDPEAGHAQRARPAVAAFRGAEPPLIVVGHSLGASIVPLVAAEAGAEGVVYLCPAPAGPLGGVDVGVRPIRHGFPFPPDRADGTSIWDPEAAVAAMYPRLPARTAAELAGRLRPGASPSDRYPRDRRPDVPGHLIAARHDEFFTLEWSRAVSMAVLGRAALELDTGHFPMAESPAALADLLISLLPA